MLEVFTKTYTSFIIRTDNSSWVWWCMSGIQHVGRSDKFQTSLGNSVMPYLKWHGRDVAQLKAVGSIRTTTKPNQHKEQNISTREPDQWDTVHFVLCYCPIPKRILATNQCWVPYAVGSRIYLLTNFSLVVCSKGTDKIFFLCNLAFRNIHKHRVGLENFI